MKQQLHAYWLTWLSYLRLPAGQVSLTPKNYPKGPRLRPGLKRLAHALAMALLVMELASISAQGQTTITGTVFFDGNNDGAYTSSKEVGFGGVVVTAYDASNVAVASTTSNLSSGTIGTYTLSGLTAGTTYRVEFTLPSGYNDGAQKSTSASSVQFVKPGATVDFGVYTTGVCDPGGTVEVVAGCAAINGSTISVASWDYFNQRQTTIANNSSNPHNDDIDNSKVGIPMGMGSRMKDKLVFFSTVTAPLTTIFPSAPDGPSAIYVADYSASGNTYNNQYKLLTKLSSLSPAIDVSQQFKVGSDVNVGELGLGGLDMTDDGKTLYVINMGNGRIVKLDISNVTLASIPSGGYTGGSLSASELTIPSSVANCTSGRFRPSALKVYAGSMYVGGVCDASIGSSSDVTLKVLKMDLKTGTWTEILNYGLSAIKGGTLRYAGWDNVKWSDTFVGTQTTAGEVQPFVNGLAIDDYGAVIIGIANRKVFSLQSDRDMGYVLRTWRNADGTMTMESAGKSGPLTSAARTDYTVSSPGLDTGADGVPNTNMIPFGPGGNWFLEIGRVKSHPYLYNGGIFIIPGTKELLAGFTDPLDGFGYAGGRYIGYDNGVTTYGISLTNTKDFALTGMESVCAESNIEIGNLVWNDVNNNGRQDPGEAGIAGINVTLKSSSGSTIATAKTDGNGNYIFSNAGGTSNGSFLYNVALSPTTSYSVTIDDFLTQTAGLSPTLANITSNGEDQRDNDGTPVGANAVIAFTTGAAGANDHTLDFGFTFSCPSPNCYPTAVTKK